MVISMPAKVPSEKQSFRAIEILQRLPEDEWQLKIEVT